MSRVSEEVRGYYDDHLKARLQGFVDGNLRVERAWKTVDRWGGHPERILEVGCGIGDISWRMNRRWPSSTGVGLDISPASLETGRKLFGSHRLSFVEGPLTKGLLTGRFDLVVMMDVYEHIARADRPTLHEALADLLSDEGRLVLAFPTPRFLAWLRENRPHEIQPVDEDVNVDTMRTLAADTGTTVLFYEEIDVWHQGDYAHAVLGKRKGWKRPERPEGRLQQLVGHVERRIRPVVPPREERIRLVRERLGPSAYPA